MSAEFAATVTRPTAADFPQFELPDDADSPGTRKRGSMIVNHKSAVWLTLRLVRFGAVAYLAVLLMLVWLETLLVYPAPRFPAGDWGAAELHGWEEVDFISADGTQLHGWFRDLQKQGSAPQGHLLYCHGNGENVAYLGNYLAELADENRLSVFVFDYRGYGKSAGTPAEAGVCADGDAAQRWLAERAKIPLADVVLMGRSLGGGVAVDLAVKNGARGLILQSTFTSMPDAAALMYPFMPVQWLMKNRYNSLAKIGRYQGPLLQSHGDCDQLIPLELGQKLHAAAPGRKEFFVNRGLGHNYLERTEFRQILAQFIASLPETSTRESE